MKTSTKRSKRLISLVGVTAGVLLIFGIVAQAGGVGRGDNKGIKIVHRQRSLQPGEVLVLEARSSRPLQNLRIDAFGNEFQAFGDMDGTAWVALVGIDLETKPGAYRIEVKGRQLDGTSLSAQKAIRVLAKKFPGRELKVDEKFVVPPADARERIERERQTVAGIFAAITEEKLWTGAFRAPVPGAVISAFGKRNVYNGQPRSPHTGADFRGAVGTPIKAPNAGRVALAADLYFSGNTVILDHGLGLFSYLAHMSEISVKEGDRVDAGSLVGKVGATGRVTGPHLHWTVRIGKARVDPLSLIQVLEDSEKVGQAKESPR